MLCLYNLLYPQNILCCITFTCWTASLLKSIYKQTESILLIAPLNCQNGHKHAKLSCRIPTRNKTYQSQLWFVSCADAQRTQARLPRISLGDVTALPYIRRKSCPPTLSCPIWWLKCVKQHYIKGSVTEPEWGGAELYPTQFGQNHPPISARLMPLTCIGMAITHCYKSSWTG